MPTPQAYFVYVSQMIRYTRARSNYVDFNNSGILLTDKETSSRTRFCGGTTEILLHNFPSFHPELVDHCNKSIAQLMFTILDHEHLPLVFNTDYVVSPLWTFLPSIAFRLHDWWCYPSRRCFPCQLSWLSRFLFGIHAIQIIIISY